MKHFTVEELYIIKSNNNFLHCPYANNGIYISCLECEFGVKIGATWANNEDLICNGDKLKIYAKMRIYEKKLQTLKT